MPKTKNILFCGAIGPAGGIESFEYYIAKRYKDDPDIDIELWAAKWDLEQLKAMQKVAKCVIWQGQQIICDNFFFPSRNCHEEILRCVQAKNIIECFHMAETFTWNTRTSPRVTKYIAVSKAGADKFTKATGKPCECYYPIIDLVKPEKTERPDKLRLITCSRLDTADKGASRMKILANELESRGIDFEWTIYGLMCKDLTNKCFNFKGRTLDRENMFQEIVNHDYFVQLSNAEGFGISIAEALNLEVPLISTPISVINEHNTNENNCVILNFDCSNVKEVADKIINNRLSFTYDAPTSNWRELLC